MIYALSAIIILSVSYFGFAGAVVEPSSAHLEQFVGLGANGNAGVMSCPNCTTHTAPQGYYPMMGMNSGTQEIAGGGDASKKGIIGSTSVMLSKMIDYIPDKNLKSGLQEYMKIVNPKAYQAGDNDVGGQNAGLARYFSTRFAENQCFQTAAINFYKDVATTLKKQNSCQADKGQNSDGKTSDTPYGCIKDRPLIDEHTGVGKNAKFDDGWLLRLAMKHSGGNPEAAFELIGMCGHDDIGQGSYSYFDFSESAKQKNAEQLLKLKEQKKKLDGDLKRAFSKFSSSEKDKTLVYQLGQHGAFLSNQINLMSSQDYAGRIENLSCPSQSSAFFLPGSLSPQADLNPNLVSKIKNIQIANPQKEHFIPAKYYHVYGSAFLGCKMVQKGMSPAQATAVQKQAARLYRGIRMCGAAGWMLQAREQMQKTLGVKNLDDSSEVEPMVIKLWEAKLHGEFTCNGMLISIDPDNIKEEKVKNSPDKNLPTNNKYNSEKCSILSMFGVTDLVENERHIVTKKILKGLERIDAAKLYDDWYFGGGHIAGTQMPCTDIRYKGPANLMKPNEGIMGKIFKPSGWSSDRYEVASKRLATYDVDFEWTIAQHEVGSSYGAKLCAESKGKVNPFEEKACSEKNHTPAQNRSGDPAGGMMSSPGVK